MTEGIRIVRTGPQDPGDRQKATVATGAMDDAALVAAVRAANPAVADAFCRRIWPQVDRTVRRLLGNRDEDREDLTQVALIEVVRSVAGYRGESSLDTWVSAVTAHVVYKYIRRKPPGRHVPLDAIAETVASGHAGGEQTLATREVLRRIVGHLDAVGEKLAWCFVLHDVLGYGLREVARMIGISEAAAQSRLVRGRKRIHESIAADPELTGRLERLPPPAK